jgi:hypothetical protein
MQARSWLQIMQTKPLYPIRIMQVMAVARYQTEAAAAPSNLKAAAAAVTVTQH